MLQAALLLIWGKADRGDPTRWHPLLFHMLDVAHVAEALWDGCLGPAARSNIARDMSLPEDEARRLVTVLAGLHDIGKATPGFQSRVPHLASQLATLSLRLSRYSVYRPHGLASALEGERILEQSGVSRDFARAAGRIIGAHHGIFPTAFDLAPHTIGPDALGDAKWSAVRTALADQLIGLVAGAAANSSDTPKGSQITPGLLPFLAGLIAVADWLGSSEHFRMEPDAELSDYVPLSRQRAHEALQRLGWLPALSPAPPQRFEGIFPFSPNVLQTEVAEMLQGGFGAQMLLVEAPMGQGKTEAALYAADVALCESGARGFYVALPTQATSNAMFARVKRDYLERRGHGGLLNIRLVHGNALLAEEYDELELAPIYTGENDHAEEGRTSALSWFAARKRPLLAPFGVGTIDQALLSVLQTRHWFVRLFGLANKVVIFDEVHAYDTYVSALLEQLLRWLAMVNSSVVLLSATLPRSRREALVSAFAGRIRADDSGHVAPYPRITRARAGTVESRPVPVSSDARRVVSLSFLPSAVSTLSAALNEVLAGGGCAAVVCNTVARAQAVYTELRSALTDSECYLFHARTPFKWRSNTEQKVLAMFGKDGVRPERAVLVATQVVEQSLDLDFDLMASEMAPIDLLLQRLGRMHRHKRERPGALSSPRLLILCERDEDGQPPAFGPTEAVYDRYVLLRSWLAIRNRDQIRLPEDIEPLVEDLYGSAPVNAPSARWEAELEEARGQAEDRRQDAARRAAGVLVGAPDSVEDLLEQFSQDLREDDDPEVHETLRAATRLGRPSVQVVCLDESADGVLRPATG
ncbi:MAG: CRISPR-associated helicase Cas3', partial [Proteobacteria bacterium]|nr:CRISPR-associated helicase Cas3' [Pseudomonadota bacterium]